MGGRPAFRAEGADAGRAKGAGRRAASPGSGRAERPGEGSAVHAMTAGWGGGGERAGRRPKRFMAVHGVSQLQGSVDETPGPADLFPPAPLLVREPGLGAFRREAGAPAPRAEATFRFVSDVPSGTRRPSGAGNKPPCARVYLQYPDVWRRVTRRAVRDARAGGTFTPGRARRSGDRRGQRKQGTPCCRKSTCWAALRCSL